MYDRVIKFIRKLYGSGNVISLHEPRFAGNEKKYLADCIDSTFVSYVGEFVIRFEDMVKDFTGAKHAVAMANGTSALHAALIVADVKKDDEVLTQALTFVATANAISYCGANPVFIDSDRDTLGMSPEKLEYFLDRETFAKGDGCCYNKNTGRKISACIPVHVFGHPASVDRIRAVCDRSNIPLIEDAAESLGSYYKGRHTGTFGLLGILSFNGNKIVTTGGGGMVITDSDILGAKLKHISTTAKTAHPWEFVHDEIGYNYRMPNLNAAVGCAQMENLPKFLEVKRETARLYKEYFDGTDILFFQEKEGCRSNYWLNAVILRDRTCRDEFLEYSNRNGIMTRPAWQLMNTLPMYTHCPKGDLENALWLQERIVNIPSSVRI